MATTAPSGTGTDAGSGSRLRGRRATVGAVVILAFAAIVVPFVVRDLGRGGAHVSPASRATAPADPTPSHQSATSHDPVPVSDPALGPRGDLPALLPTRAALDAGTRVRLGDVTDGVLRRTPTGWQVFVRWDGRLQPVPTRGPVSLGGGPGAHAPASWVSGEGQLYTRVATTVPGRFRVFEWDPSGGTAYVPPALVATALGLVCFDRSFTAFGNCHVSG
jgi:hypothetical protein